MATLDVLLKATAQDKGVRKFFRDATKLADKFTASAERASQAGSGLGGISMPGVAGARASGGSRGSRGAGGDPISRALQQQARERAVQGKRASREAERVIDEQVRTGRLEARAQQQALRERQRQARQIKNLSDEQLTQIAVEREITRRRQRDAKRRALDTVGRERTGPQRLETAENLATAAGVFEQAGARIEQGVRGSFDAFKDYEKGVREVSTLTGDIPIDQIQRLTKEATAEFGGLPTDQVAAFYQIVSAGATNAADAQAQLTSANQLAIAGSASQEGSVLAVSKAVVNFGVDAGKAADSLFVAVQKGQTTVEQMARALPIVAQAASTAGLSIDETNAAIAVLSKRFPSAAEGASGFRQALSNIAKPTKGAAKEAKRLGIDFSTAGIQAAGGLEEFLLKLRAAEKFDEDTLAKLFESTEARAAVGGLIDGLDELNATTRASIEGVGAAEKAYQDMASTTAQEAARAEAQLELFKIQAGEALVPALRLVAETGLPVIKFLGDVAKDSPGLAKAVGFMAVGFLGFTKIMSGVANSLSAYNTLAGLSTSKTTQLGTAGRTASTGMRSMAAAGAALPTVFAGAAIAIGAFEIALEAAKKPLREYESTLDRITQKQSSLPTGTEEERGNIQQLETQRKILAAEIAQTKNKRERKKLEQELLDIQNKIAGAQEKVDTKAALDARLRERENLVELVNASRQQLAQSRGGAAREALSEGRVGGFFAAAAGDVLSRASGADAEAERIARQNELDLARFDRTFGTELGLTQEQQFTSKDFTTLGDAAAQSDIASRLGQQAIEALTTIAQNTQAQPWQGPSMDAGLT